MQTLHTLAVAQDDRMIGLDLDDVAVDGCIAKAPCGGAKAGRSPVDRGNQGLKRSLVTDGAAFVITRCLIQRARTRYRWDNQPTTRRLK